MALTPKQEGFCLSYRETGNASEAYRRNYNCENTKPESINRLAFALLQNVNITSRLADLGEITAKRHRLTVDDLLAELEEARIAALTAETVQASAAANATMGKAKLLGMDKAIIDHKSSDGSMTPQPAVKIDANLIKSVLTKLNEEC